MKMNIPGTLSDRIAHNLMNHVSPKRTLFVHGPASSFLSNAGPFAFCSQKCIAWLSSVCQANNDHENEAREFLIGLPIQREQRVQEMAFSL